MVKFMRSMILYAALIGSIIIASAIGMSYAACTYDEYKGQCKICSIMQTNVSIHQEKVIGGPGYAGFEVKFEFNPVQPLPFDVYDRINKSVIGCKNVLALYNSWYPGPRFLQKFNITEGARFNCSLKLIKSGSFSPEIIRFKDIDQHDYFESRAAGSGSPEKNKSN
jgi:hypothetical protein